MISVVIPVHGVEDYLDRCLDSVLAWLGAAAGPGFARGDRRRRRVPRRLRRDPGRPARPPAAGAHHPTAVGPGPARDLGAKEATGEYVWFVDGDDELADGALAAVAGALAQAAARRAGRRLREPVPGRVGQPERRREVPAAVPLSRRAAGDRDARRPSRAHPPDHDGVEQGVPPGLPGRPGRLVRLRRARPARGCAGHHAGPADRRADRRAGPRLLPLPPVAPRLVPGRRQRRQLQYLRFVPSRSSIILPNEPSCAPR